MAESRPVINNKLNDWYKYLIEDVPKPIKSKVSILFLNVKCIQCLNDGKFGEEAEKEQNVKEENIKSQIEIPQISGKDFTLDKVPHLYNNFIQLALTQKCCLIKLLE